MSNISINIEKYHDEWYSQACKLAQKINVNESVPRTCAQQNTRENNHNLRTIYFAIIDTHLNYANLILGQNLHVVSRIVILQKKALRIMNFQSRYSSHSSPLFKSNHILILIPKYL